MRKRWIISLLISGLLLTIYINPVIAALSQGNFIPSRNVQTVTTDGKIKMYSVAKGDTLWGIARKFNVDLETIRVMNNLDKQAVLEIGQVLEVPYSRSRVYAIKKGDTLWDIANKYDISVEQLLAANIGVNPKNLKIGQKLIIPDSSGGVAAAINQSSRGMTTAVMLWPVVGSITSAFGWRSSGYHHGIDIAGKMGDTIKSAAAGRVTFAGTKSVYGKTVIIKHPNGKETLYAHCQDILVKKNQYVTKGQSIATIGMTGKTTGPHVHFEVKNNGENENPLRYLRD